MLIAAIICYVFETITFFAGYLCCIASVSIMDSDVTVLRIAGLLMALITIACMIVSIVQTVDSAKGIKNSTTKGQTIAALAVSASSASTGVVFMFMLFQPVLNVVLALIY